MPLLIEYDENVSPAGVFKAKRRHSLDTLADLETEKNEAGSSPTVVSDHSSDSEETLTSNKRLKEAEPISDGYCCSLDTPTDTLAGV